MKTRVRKRGKNEDRLTGNMVAAEFMHFTARPVKGKLTPHLHAHCIVFNVTYDEVEKRFKASQQGDLKRDGDYWEAAFHARFAKRLNALGYSTRKDGTSFPVQRSFFTPQKCSQTTRSSPQHFALTSHAATFRATTRLH